MDLHKKPNFLPAEHVRQMYDQILKANSNPESGPSHTLLSDLFAMLSRMPENGQHESSSKEFNGAMFALQAGGLQSTSGVDLKGEFVTFPPLVWAIANGNLEGVKYLVDQSVSPVFEVDWITNDERLMELLAGCLMGCPKPGNVVKMMMAAFRAYITVEGRRVSAVHAATSLGNQEMLEYVLKALPRVSVDDGSFSALHLAVYSRRLDTIKYLASTRALKVNVGDGVLTPLHIATLRGDFEMVEYLLEVLGAKTEVRCSPAGSCPLQFAAAAGHLPIVTALIKRGADVNAVDGEKMTPLMCAIFMGGGQSLDVVRELLRAGAHVNPGQLDPTARSPLHTSISFGRFDVFRLLLEAGADVNALSEDGLTPLQNAVNTGNMEYNGALVEHGAKP